MAAFEPVLLQRLNKPECKTLEGYRADGGYRTLTRALKEMSPDQVTTVVKDAGLRGRGGAGFPTGLKWTFLPKGNSGPVYLCVNCDESEPCTFNNRYLIECDPHQVLEGIILASYAIRARVAYFYVRYEYGTGTRTMQRAMGSLQRELAVFEPGKGTPGVVGRIVAKGLADELLDRGYLVVDGLDGKAHYLALPARAELADYPIGGVVETRSLSEPRAVDRSIASLAADGLYRTDHHLALARSQSSDGHDTEALVERHVRRLEALRRAGIVERLAEGVWRVPADLPEQGRQHDARRLGDVAVELRTPLPLEQQVRAVGATWLDQQLIGGNRELVDKGFGKEVREALRQRADFLVELGLAERQGQRVALSRNLLATLRGRELAATAREISAQTGMQYRPAVEGQRVSGIYRRSVQLASGRYALLNDGIGFSLVPWKPVIEQKLGQSVSAVIQGNSVSWQLGRQRGPSIG